MEVDPKSAGEELQSFDVAVGQEEQVVVCFGDKRKREEEEEEEKENEEETGGGKAEAAAEGEMGEEALSNRNPLWKTSLCSYYRRNPNGGGCSHGESCRYAHSEAELRPRPDSTWDPTSERAKKSLRSGEAGDGGPLVEEEAEPVDLESLDKCIVGIPRKWGAHNLKSFLDGQGIHYKAAKKKNGMAVGFLTFDSTEQLKHAIEVLNEKTTSSGKQVKVVDAACRSHGKKPGTQISSDQTKQKLVGSPVGNEDPSLVDGDDRDEKVDSVADGVSQKTRSARDVATPLADMTYFDQLEQKKNSLMKILKKLPKNARKACPDGVPLPEWVIKCRDIGGLPCKLEGILESPLTDGYRNKCEFSVGYSSTGTCTVGFMVGNFREGITAVEEPIDCPNVSRISSEFALIFQEFLQSSVLNVWDRIENKGFWRQFTVREGRNSVQGALSQNEENHIAEVMLIIQVCSVGVDDELMRNEFERMVKYLEQGAANRSPRLPLTTIVVQDHTGISNAAPADCPLMPLLLPKRGHNSSLGKECSDEARIHDYISNLCFSISPTAFFQVNTLAAERLYSLAGDWADLNSDTLLFDICCGTGTIGLTLAHRVGMVVGIEMNKSAVSDAQRNAFINGIKNCRFVCGKAEDVIGSLLKEYLDVPLNHTIYSCTNKDDSTNDMTNGTLESETGASTDALAIEASNVEISAEELKGVDHEKSYKDTAEGKNVVEPEARVSPEKDLNNSGMTERVTTEENQEDDELVQDSNTSETEKITSHLHQFKNVVALVDPPRVGLHRIVIKALRTHPRIRRLVYISCNPDSLVANAIELCTPTAEKSQKGKGNRGWWNMSNAGIARHRVKSMPNSEPFRPVRAMAVDLFPHTSHCEMVMLFER